MKKAIVILKYYVNKTKLLNSFEYLKKQVRKCVKGRLNTASIRIGCVVRGFLARRNMVNIKRNRMLQIKAQLLREKTKESETRYKLSGVFYHLYVDSLTYAFGWSAFCVISVFVIPSL
jgi:hypothetical protein